MNSGKRMMSKGLQYVRLQRKNKFAELNDGPFKVLTCFLESLDLPGLLVDLDLLGVW